METFLKFSVVVLPGRHVIENSDITVPRCGFAKFVNMFAVLISTVFLSRHRSHVNPCVRHSSGRAGVFTCS